MEQGLSRALMSSYTEASMSERRMLVQRSQDRREYMLMSEEGDEILLARATDTAARSFDIYIPSGGDPPCALGPAFKVAEEKGNGQCRASVVTVVSHLGGASALRRKSLASVTIRKRWVMAMHCAWMCPSLRAIHVVVGAKFAVILLQLVWK